MASKRDIRFPADAVLALRRTLVRQVGTEAATRALQEAGYAAGDILFERLTGQGDLAGTPQDTFWDRMAGLFRELGWGSLTHEELHPGVGALVGREWFEADPDASRPTCLFTTGVLANILGRVAGEDVSVLQVECDDGHGCCRFLFGSGPVVQDVYAALREGRDLQTALGSLG
jgi:predicted hydrocarbon binding protein